MPVLIIYDTVTECMVGGNRQSIQTHNMLQQRKKWDHKPNRKEGGTVVNENTVITLLSSQEAGRGQLCVQSKPLALAAAHGGGGLISSRT